MPKTFEAQGITLEEVRDYVWEIEQEGGMNVPARVLASESLLEHISEDKTLQQLKNTAHLPGVQNHAICMPDGHQGYGFPVGGVVGIDVENGCISPGGVGYDINCIAGGSEVRLPFGRRVRIRELADRFDRERAIVKADSEVESDIRLFTKNDDKPVYEIETAAGDTIEATADHEFQTPEGMVPLRNLDLGDVVFVDPFDGFQAVDPPEFTVLETEDFADADPQLIHALEERDLLPLRSTDEAFHRLLKLVGYHTGDGSFHGSMTWFYGDPEDLASIREDIRAIGFTPSRVFERDRSHDIDGNHFDTTEYSVKATANAFRQLLEKLGAPSGPKVASNFGIPSYLDRVADWQQALYLSALFGAELSAPDTHAPKNFYAPSISHNRLLAHADAGEAFMHDLKRLLDGLEVRTNALEEVERTEREAGTSVRFRFGIKSDDENLIRFFTTIGYRYNRSKQQRAVVAAQYLKRKQRVTDDRARIAAESKAMADGGMPAGRIKREVRDAGVNERFIERSLYSGRKGHPRPPMDFPDFETFRDQSRVKSNLSIGETIARIKEVGEADVYDIGVSHEAHNFVANGFVVSNCGVRMVKTNLTYDDLRGREEELVDALFDRIPQGLGKGGVVETDMATIEKVLDRGMDWALEAGYAVEDDLEHCEDNGYREEADPTKISDKAKDRGKVQIGSLGSGNHFLEVQRVTDVFREDVAADFGLEEEQIVVLIHTGSRGLGHQTCTDYLRKIEKAHAGLLERLPDKELAAAPSGSQLAEDYYQAMGACINFAWTNRQLVTYGVREVFADVFDEPWQDLGLYLLYDVAHNIAKKETHEVGGEDRELYVHRKGATRAFPAGHPEVPKAYRDVGQPVIIPGSMGAGSYVLRGGAEAMGLTFGSTAHGAGRIMSRTQAKKDYWGEDVQQELREQQHIYVKAASGATIAEEAPGVYKDVSEVVRVSDALGIGDKVARTYPVCNIKG